MTGSTSQPRARCLAGMTVARRRPVGERARPSTSIAVSLGNARVVASTLALFALVASASADASDGARPAARAPARLVAVPDLHGDLAHARRSFQLAGISEDGERWSAGANTRFVQTGDVVDRGERSIEIVQIIANLQREAATRVNSSFTALLGNHELLTLQGDYRYVAREELLRLGKASLESKNLGGREMGTGYGLRAYWAAGQMAWRSAFSPDAEFGAQIRSNRPLLTVQGEGSCATLFSHAGVRRAHLAKHGDSIEALNAFARDAIAAVSDGERGKKTNADAGDAPPPVLGSLDVFDVESPVWTRFWSADWSKTKGMEVAACAELDSILALVGAKRMVVGHTVQPGGMTTRCAGRLHLIDVGVSDAYIGRGAAWSCEEGTTRAHYDGKTVILEGASSKADRTRSDESAFGPSADDALEKLEKKHVDDASSSRYRGWFGRSRTFSKTGADAGKTDL